MTTVTLQIQRRFVQQKFFNAVVEDAAVICFVIFDHADINIKFSGYEFIEDDIFHDVVFLLLTEV